MQMNIKIDFNTLDIRVSYKVILSLLMDMISILKVLKVTKEVVDGVHFLHADKHQSF